MLFLQSALPRPLLLQKKSQWLLLSCKKCQLSPARTLQRSFGTQTETFNFAKTSSSAISITCDHAMRCLRGQASQRKGEEGPLDRGF